MKRIILASLAILTACSAPVDVNALKNQIREELKKEAAPSPSPTGGPSMQPTSTPKPLPTPAQTPQPTPTPYQLPQETKDAANQAIDALLAISSKTEAGISYVNYSSELGVVKVAVDKAERQTDFNRHPSAKIIKESYLDFSWAKDLWKCHLDEGALSNQVTGICSIVNGPLIEKYGVQPTDTTGNKTYSLAKSLGAFWVYGENKAKSAFSKRNEPPINTDFIQQPTSQAAYEKTFISGFVEAGGSRKPGASIEIKCAEVGYSKTVETDASGEYSVDDVPSGKTVSIVASAPGRYVFSRREEILKPNQSKDKTINRLNFVLITF